MSKTEPIEAARFERNAEGLPFSSRFDDIYHPASGALTQARHVFLAGNGLPERWRGRNRFTVLETGFGLGNNFLATWDAWRRDAQACDRLHFISIERHPLGRDDLRAALEGSPLAGLADALVDAWPPLTHNLHRLAFEEGRVQLLLAFGDVAAWLPELVATVDAFYLDGFAPARNPAMWQPRVCKALARLAAPGATLATWSASRGVRDGLSAAGFTVRLAAGQGGKRDITLAHYAPAFTPRRATSRRSASASDEKRALIIGAGLAGCATAWALAEQGWTSTIFDRHEGLAMEASGNPAGLFHGVVHPQDGSHARFNRAAALEVIHAVRRAIAQHGVAGALDGLLRMETSGMTVDAMRSVLGELGLPADFVQAVDAEAVESRCGLPLAHPAWFYPGGGWVDPAGLARSFFERAGNRAGFRGGVDVAALRWSEGRWQLLDSDNRPIDEAECVVLANAADAGRLAGPAIWPLKRIRGQISSAPTAVIEPSFTAPRLPIAGHGYLLPEVAGRVMFGATSEVDDDDPAVRREDHAHNFSQLSRLIGRPLAADPGRFEGRTGWRTVAPDRLPLIGAVPDLEAIELATRLDQPRFVPRRPGLFVFTALGSRGITWSALGGELLAALVSGAPCVLESSLIDAVDPARFVSRAARRLASAAR